MLYAGRRFMDLLLLTQVIQELDANLRGGRIDRLSRNAEGDLLLAVTRDRKSFTMLLSPDREMPRIHLLSTRPDRVPASSGFELYLKAHLSGAVIRSIGTLNEDRIAEIRCTRSRKEYRILFELFGPHSNILLCDGSSNILAVLRPVHPGVDVERPLHAGVEYALPGKGSGAGDRRDQKLTLTVNDLSPDRTDLTANRAVEQMFAQHGEVLKEARLRKGLSRMLDKALVKAARKVAAIQADLLNSEKAEEFRTTGDLLLANLGSLRKGEETALLTGSDGRSIAVKLDPRRTATENAESYFRRYKKAKAGHILLSRRLEQSAAEVSRLEQLGAELDSAGTIDSLSDLQKRLGNRGSSGKGGTDRSAQGSTSVPYRTFRFAGWEILVGKNAAGNDIITREISRPDDLWLHAEGTSGSHVLVRNPGRAEVPPHVLLKAASLAAYYSRAKSSSKVPVAYTEARYVKRPKGAKPGLVTLVRRRTVMVEPESGTSCILDKHRA